MGRNDLISTLFVGLSLGWTILQQGGMGTAQGPEQRRWDSSARAIESSIGRYLNGEEIRNIVTPGEYSEWKIKFKANDVIFAEARSDAFDPALEVVDDKGKSMAFNDDRYPGDQRPLLSWRCPQEGEYTLRVKCFHDKAGGQVFLRYVVYPSVDAVSDKALTPVDERSTFLVRVPLKAGVIKELVENQDEISMAGTGDLIGENGLPVRNYASPLQSTFYYAVMPPVDGYYYVMASKNGKVLTPRIEARELKPTPISSGESAKVPGGAGLYSLKVKRGDVLRTTTPELRLSARIIMQEQPDLSKFDVNKPDQNPFFPHPRDLALPDGNAVVFLPSRNGDGRELVTFATRDATLWLITDGRGHDVNVYTVSVKPAPKPFAGNEPNSEKLRIGRTDYWAFDAKAGDVMTFESSTGSFAQRLRVLGPNLEESWVGESALDQPTVKWNLIFRQPGRHLVAVAAQGDGGGGEYVLNRHVFSPKEFGKGSPAAGELSDDQVNVWKFTVRPNDPLLIRMTASNRTFQTSMQTEDGYAVTLPLIPVDNTKSYGILRVDRPTTYLLVLIGQGGKSSYTIDVSELPGFKG